MTVPNNAPAPAKAGKTKKNKRNKKQKSKQNGSGPQGVQENDVFSDSRRTGGTLSAGTAYSSTQKQKAPKITRTPNGMRIHHRELVQTVAGAIAFTATKIACQPGLASVFSWLAPQAAQWEQYKFHRLKFDYITRTGATTVGSVLLAPDYDPSDGAPTTEQIASTFRDTVEDVAWRNVCCELDPTGMFGVNPRKFVRSGPVAGTDIKLYDAANLWLCVVEETGSSNIGKLWVEYDVEFWLPQTSPSGSTASQSTSVATVHAAQTLTTATPVAVAWDTITTDPLTIGTPVAGVFTPAAGTYLVRCQITGNDSSAEAFATKIELMKNGVSLTNKCIAEADHSGATVAAAKNSLCVFGVVTCNGTTDTFQITATFTGAAGTLTIPVDNAQLIVTPA